MEKVLYLPMVPWGVPLPWLCPPLIFLGGKLTYRVRHPHKGVQVLMYGALKLGLYPCFIGPQY